jgi:hypothetical protein
LGNLPGVVVKLKGFSALMRAASVRKLTRTTRNLNGIVPTKQHA